VQAAYAVAAWLQRADHDGLLGSYKPWLLPFRRFESRFSHFVKRDRFSALAFCFISSGLRAAHK
jgi:hypothetical protein